jgi:hypothetical protein
MSKHTHATVDPSTNSSKQHPTRMVLLTLYVTQSQLDALRKQSSHTGLTVSKIVRNAIDKVVTVSKLAT